MKYILTLDWWRQRPLLWLAYVIIVLTGFVCFFFFKVLNITRVYGRHNIPKVGRGVLFVSNHQTMYDSFMIGTIGFFPSVIFYPSRPPVNFAAAENYFGKWYTALLMQLLRAVSVKKRDDGLLMRRYLQVLERNNILIFYQGGRSFNLSQSRLGPAWIVARSKEPPIVIPIYIEGMSKIFGGPKTKGVIGRWLPLSMLRYLVVSFGEPVNFSGLDSIDDVKDRVGYINQRIIDSVKSLQREHSLQRVS